MESLARRRPAVSLVLDSSATLAWIYGDERTDAIRAVFDEVADNGASVPALWRLEVANSLTMAVRRGRIDADFRNAALSDLEQLEIRVDGSTDARLDRDAGARGSPRSPFGVSRSRAARRRGRARCEIARGRMSSSTPSIPTSPKPTASRSTRSSSTASPPTRSSSRRTACIRPRRASRSSSRAFCRRWRRCSEGSAIALQT